MYHVCMRNIPDICEAGWHLVGSRQQACRTRGGVRRRRGVGVIGVSRGGGLGDTHGSVWLVVALAAFQLHLEPLHADLEAVHRLDGAL